LENYCTTTLGEVFARAETAIAPLSASSKFDRTGTFDNVRDDKPSVSKTLLNEISYGLGLIGGRTIWRCEARMRTTAIPRASDAGSHPKAARLAVAMPLADLWSSALF
jgi:hypothetical protein